MVKQAKPIEHKETDKTEGKETDKTEWIDFNKAGLEKLFKDLKEKINKDNFYFVLRDLFDKVSPDFTKNKMEDIQIFRALLGRFMLENLVQREKKFSPAKQKMILEQIIKYNNSIKYTPSQLVEMKKDRVKRFKKNYLLDGEKILLSFRGTVNVKRDKKSYMGKIYLTNQRVLVIGREKVKDGGFLGGFFGAILGGLLGGL